MIELGPKGTGKSYVYTNLSKYAWLLGGGKTSRARLFYNKATKQFGVIKNHDVVGMDEISTMTFAEPDEMQAILKVYLEAGETKVDSVPFQSECGLVLLGNIPLNKDLKPQHTDYFRNLPEMFHESATMDRFHGFIEGWKLPRLNQSHIMEGWTLNTEYFSTVLHLLRPAAEYDDMFDQLVETNEDCDLRDKKAVKRIAAAYHKLLFPHIHSMEEIEEEDQVNFKQLYAHYCLEPAVAMRQIIRQQCHLIDKEFKAGMGEFNIIM
jgi:ATP-dependent Lon protease